MDTHKNFAKSTLASGITSGATSLTVAAGEGVRFPTVPFNATIWNKTDYADPTDDSTKEIVRVTGISTDTLTIARAQEGTTGVAHNTSGKTYGIVAPITARTMQQITDVLNGWKVLAAQVNRVNTTPMTLFQFDLAAGTTYDVELWLPMTLDNSGGGFVLWSATGGLTGTYAIMHVMYHDTGFSTTAMYPVDTTFPPADWSIDGIPALVLKYQGTLVINAAGTLSVSFHQFSASGTSSVLRGAKMRCVPIQS